MMTSTSRHACPQFEDARWRPVRISAHGFQAPLARVWDCEPAWDVDALYDEADEELPSAAPDDQPVYVFWNRHIDHRFRIEYPRTTEDSPRPLSKTIGDAAREWRLVREHLGRYLVDAGLTPQSDAAAIARCLADTFKHDSYFMHKPHCSTFAHDVRALCNPIEGLLHQCFCVGCAWAYAVLADAAGLACRTIGCGAHRVAEVRVDGRWRMVENSCRHEADAGLEALMPASFMEMTLRPGAYPDCVPEAKRHAYQRFPSGQYHFMGGTWQSPMTLRLAGSNAAALYPELTRWGFKSDGRRMPLVRRSRGFYWQDGIHRSSDADALHALRRRNCPFPFTGAGPAADFLYHPFEPGHRLRQSVWLDDIDGMRGLEVTIPFAPEPHLDFSDVLGEQLVLRVGAFEASLRALGVWPPRPPDDRCHRHVTAVIPNDALTPHAVNWIELCNHSEVTMQAPFLPAAMTPYLPPLGVA